jgi:uncharacterized protein YjiK
MMKTGTRHLHRASGVESTSLLPRSLFLLAVFLPVLAVGQTNYTPYTFTTVAGLTSIGSADGTRTNAQFNRLAAVAVDSAGNTYVADTDNSTIRKVTPAGVVTTLAGSPGNIGSTDGTGSAARFFDPAGLALDSSGNIYVADTGNNTIRKVTPAGVVSTLAGSPDASGYTDGTGTAARFDIPVGITVDSSGNVYVADTFNNTIRKITPAGVVTTLAGLGMAPSKGSTDGTGTAARFYALHSTAIDSSGNLYVADTDNCAIRKITPAGVVTTLAGSPGYAGSADGTGSAGRFDLPSGIAADTAGNLYVADTDNCAIRKITPAGVVTTLAGSPGYAGSADGTGTVARFYSPGGVAVDSSSNVYVSDTNNQTIRKVTSAGAVTTLAGVVGTAGSTDGTGTAALFSRPIGLTVDSGGNLYVADTANSAIRKITAAGVVTTMVGAAGVGGSTDGTGTAGLFYYPQGITADNAGNLYVADTGNETIRMVTSAGVVTTLAGTVGIKGQLDGTGSAAQFNFPSGLSVDGSGNLYVADAGNNTIRKVSSGGAAYTTFSGVVTTFAGSVGNAGYANGTGSAAQFNNPAGLTMDSSGNIYVADSSNNTIRKVTPAGVVTTVAGSPTDSSNPSRNGQIILARFNAPTGVAVDSSNNIYVADAGNSEIRLITSAGIVSTLAGSAGIRGLTDGTGSSAYFNMPEGLALDSAGNIHVADTYNNSVRKVTSAGVVTTLAGLTGNRGSTDGANSDAQFNAPMGTAVDGSGNVYVADTNNSTIRKIAASGVVTTLAGAATDIGSTDGTGTGALFNRMEGAAADSAGNVYVADSGNNTIRMITPTGVVSTLAGMAGTTGSTDGTGTAARFIFPTGVIVDNSGSVYVADAVNNTIRKITSGGVVTTLAGSAGVTGSTDGTGTAALFSLPSDVAVDGSGNVYVADTDNDTIRKITSAGVVTTLAGGAGSKGHIDGAGTAARFYAPYGLSADTAGNVYVADTGNDTIRKITSAGVVTTLAGSPSGIGYADGTGTAARFYLPYRLALDSAGNLYVADSGNNIIRKVTPAGVVTTFAGTWFAGSAGNSDGTGAAARFNEPQGVAVDSSGNIYVGDTRNATIRKIAPDGTVTTLAGSPYGSGSSDGVGNEAQFFLPTGLAVDSANNVYVADAYNAMIRKIASDGTVSTLAASLGEPTSVAVDSAGNVYVADTTNHTIRKVTAGGIVTTLVGTAGTSGYVDGVGTAAQLNQPEGVAVDSAGNVYVADTGNNSIRKITSNGTVITLAGSHLNKGSQDGTGNAAWFSSPIGVSVDSSGNVYVADTGNNAIRMITPAGVVTTLGGTAGITGATDGTGSAALFSSPYDVTVDNTGNIYVADTFNNTIRKGQRSGFPTITTQPASQSLALGQKAVFSVTADLSSALTYQWQILTYGSSAWSNLSDNASYSGTNTATLTVNAITAAMNGNSFQCVITNATGSVTTSPANLVVSGSLTVSTLAGQGGASGNTDGTGTAARFNSLNDVAVDSTGNVYVADTNNHTIRKITPAGVVTTLAGQAGSSGGADGTGNAARFNHPTGVAVSSAGIVYVSDTDNNTIREITSAGVVTTLAGQAGVSGSVDGTGSAASFYGPSGIVVNNYGYLDVADTLNHTIREVASTGVVVTLAGQAGISGSADGIGTVASFHGPQGLAVDTSGHLYVADTNNNTIRKIVVATGTVTTVAGLAGTAGSADGTTNSARFHYPSGVAADSTGNLYITDTDNHTIREITAAGTVTTLAGQAGISGSADGTGAAASFNYPTGIAVGNAGTLYIADTNNHTVRLGIFPVAPTISVQPQGQTVTAGASVEFSVVATGNPTYQWYLNGTAISGATSSTYSLTSAQSANAGDYTVTVTNSYGSVTSSKATLTVNAATTTSSSGGGGALSLWFYGALSLLVALRKAFRRK